MNYYFIYWYTFSGIDCSTLEKTIYLDNRRFLTPDHPLRKSNIFLGNSTPELRPPLPVSTSQEELALGEFQDLLKE